MLSVARTSAWAGKEIIEVSIHRDDKEIILSDSRSDKEDSDS